MDTLILILCGIFMVGLGLLNLIRPDLIYEFEEVFRSSYSGEPSDWYLLSHRIGGVCMIIAGIVFIVLAFVLP